MLNLVRRVHPRLYEELSNMRDNLGNPTDIYVKVIRNFGDKTGIYGVTHVSSVEGSPHECKSIYGKNSICIRVTGDSSGLQFLVHEFGHALYLIPNLKRYKHFYETAYKSQHSVKGHKKLDPSHVLVKSTMKEFKVKLKEYRKQRKNLGSLEAYKQ